MLLLSLCYFPMVNGKGGTILIDQDDNNTDTPKFNLVKLSAWGFAFLYMLVNAGMLFYLVDSPNRTASTGKVEYLEILAERTSSQELKLEMQSKIQSSKQDGKITNREFEDILDLYKSKLK